MSEFLYEEDESSEKILAYWEKVPKGTTAPPIAQHLADQLGEWSTPHLDDDGVLNLSDCTIEEDLCREMDHSCKCGAPTPWECYCDPCPLCDDVEFIDVVVPC